MRYLNLGLFLFTLLYCQAILAIENVSEIAQPRNWVQVTDPTNQISDSAQYKINQMLKDHEAKTTNQIAVVVVDKIENRSVKDFATELFNTWKIGKKNNDNGLLVLLSVDDHRIEFETGYGLEGILPDAICKRIQLNEMLPYFKKGDYATGLENGIAKAISTLEKNKIEEFKPKSSTFEDFQAYWILIAGVFSSLFSIFFSLALIVIMKSRSTKAIIKNNLDQKSKPSRQISHFLLGMGITCSVIIFVLSFVSIQTDRYEFIFIGYGLTSLLITISYAFKRILNLKRSTNDQQKYDSVVFNPFPLLIVIFWPLPGIIFYLVDRSAKMAARKRSKYCNLCNSEMSLLPSDAAIPLLSKSQQHEQEIQSQEYDIWKCSNDNETIVFTAAGAKFSKYQPCPKCNTRSFYFLRRNAVTANLGYDIYRCEFCGFEKHNQYYSSDSSSSTGGFGSSSSSSSSSTGGGRSGGGGAGSSW